MTERVVCRDHWATLVQALLDTYGYSHVVQIPRDQNKFCEYWGCRLRAYVEVS